MAIYKKLGAISFFAEYQQLEIFQTEEFWVLQTKPHPRRANKQGTDLLQFVINRYNQLLGWPALQLYSEQSKPPCIILNKSNAEPSWVDLVHTTSQFCTYMHSILNSLLMLDNQIVGGEIHGRLFFRIKNQLVYLHLPSTAFCLDTLIDGSQQSRPVLTAVKDYINTLTTSSNIPSLRLLTSKLANSPSLRHMKDELQYFESVYVQGTLNVNERKSNDQHSPRIRKYYRRSDNRKIQSCHNSNKLNLALTFTRKAKPQSKNKKSSLSLGSFTSTQVGGTNRPTSSKALHLDLHKANNSRQKLIMSSSYRTTSHFSSKGHFSCMKKNSQSSFQGTKTSMSSKITRKSAKYNNNSTVLLTMQVSHNENTGQKNHSAWMKDIVNKSLTKWQDKNQKHEEFKAKIQKNAAVLNKGLKKHGRPSRKIEPQHQINLQHFEQIQSLLAAQPHYGYLCQPVPLGSEKQDQNPQQSIHKIEISINSPVSNIIPTIPNETTPAHEGQSLLTLTDTKTTRRKKSPSQIIETSLLNLCHAQVQRYNIIGQCVTRTHGYVSRLKQDRIFWQLPTFLLYKQFYIKRSNLQEQIKTQKLPQLAGRKEQSQQLEKFLKELAQENEVTKQSLVRLLKMALKKGNKFFKQKKDYEQVTKCLNLDYSRDWHMHLDQMMVNYLHTLEELRKDNPYLMSYEIQVCEAYIIAKDRPIDIMERKCIEIEKYDDPATSAYFSKCMNETSNILKKCLKGFY